MKMNPFKWNNSFSVDINAMDDQHKVFFDILDRLGEASGGNSQPADEESEFLFEFQGCECSAIPGTGIFG